MKLFENTLWVARSLIVAFGCAYLASLLFCVLPTIVAEFTVGQLTGRAPVLAFYNLCPSFKGVGVSMILFTLVVLACMTKFVAWLFIYIYYLFWTVQASRPGLPWLHCKNFPEFLSFPCREAGSISNFSHESHTKLSAVQAESSLMQFMTSVERASESIDEYGELQIDVLIAQAAVWVIVFSAICLGVRFLGKFVAFTLVVSFVMLLGLLMAVAASGGFDKVFYVYWNATDWSRLYEIQVWKLACEQAILASGIGFGVFITLSSYNKRDRNVVCNAFLVILWHVFITLVQTLTVLGFVGVVSQQTGLQVGELIEKGDS
ncbi:unnamed protein product [Caenorhabditis auriculariae]|uniref:Uncharacterized protein n=1 Tax=Caenorhabditis auriculariae TaxID=2777116 RepID=A0A8S1HZ84_9PELO|nr:unnamed protein product [Caenorhabditis auriculariae]